MQNLDCVNIGLINNMPDLALVPTERQLFDLLSAAAGKLVIRLHLYSMDTDPSAPIGDGTMCAGSIAVSTSCLTAVLTGSSLPALNRRTDGLTEEPYWESFVQVIDWAKENTFSSVCSCLAVHGAVLHLDGIERHPLPDKCIGVFNQIRAMASPVDCWALKSA